ncbi:MAG: rRNA maturation RNase YbeY [Rhodobacteraceae bacterium]|nr:rRNA maturation RNase YbeY [Paracoccaceae bacterium]
MPEKIDILIKDDRWQEVGLKNLCCNAFAAVFKNQKISGKGYSLSVLACDDAKVARLNEEFCRKPNPTNVLSWPEYDLAAFLDGGLPDTLPPPAGLEDSIGDIAIAFETCVREAADNGVSLADHTTRLMVHAALHLLGFDHKRDGDAALMEGLETKILATLGVKDPYC